MTLVGAVRRVLRSSDGPLSINDIANRIALQGFFVFRTSSPRTVVGHAIRRHCAGVNIASSGKRRFFREIGDDLYDLIERKTHRRGGVSASASSALRREISAPKKRTIIAAVKTVMKEAGHPLPHLEVHRRIVDGGLYAFHAQRPEQVVQSVIRRHCQGIDFPSADPVKHFGVTNDGQYMLLQNPVRGKRSKRQRRNDRHREKESSGVVLAELKRVHLRHRSVLKEELLHALKRLAPSTFEQFAKQVLDAYGFEDVHVTNENIGRDGGIDGYGRLKVGIAHIRVAFQCKRWAHANVGRRDLDAFRGAISGRFDMGVFFTTASFVSGARDASIRTGAVPIVLVDGAGIVDLMIEKGLGVEREFLPVFSYALDLLLSEEKHVQVKA